MFTEANMLVFKVTKDCNLRCKYCYVSNKDKYKGIHVKFDTYKKIIDKVVEDKSKAINKTRFALVFHGGEPLLLQPSYLAKMFKYAYDNFTKANIDFSLGLQTNLTLLNDENAEILSEYGVNVGVSFDGLKRSNLLRMSLPSKFFESKFKLLKDYNIDFGVLIVVNSLNYKNTKKNADYIIRKYNLPGLKVNYVEDVNSVGNIEVSGIDFYNYAVKPFIDDFMKKGYTYEANTSLIIEKFIIRSIAIIDEVRRSNCGSKICGGGTQIIEVEPDGSVYFCGRYSNPFNEAYIGFAWDKDFLDLHRHKRYLDFAYEKHKLLLKYECDLCPADKICDHGCMAFHFSKYNKWGIRTNLVCPIFKNVHNYLVKNKKQIIEAFIKKHMGTQKEFEYDFKEKIIKIKPRYENFMKQLSNIIKIELKNYHTLKFRSI